MLKKSMGTVDGPCSLDQTGADFRDCRPPATSSSPSSRRRLSESDESVEGLFSSGPDLVEQELQDWEFRLLMLVAGCCKVTTSSTLPCSYGPTTCLRICTM